MAEKTFHSITLPGQDTARVPLTAAEFSTSVAYKVKDYCTYQGKLYRCTTAHTAGIWNDEHFTPTDIDTEFDRKLDIPASQASAPANPRVGDLWIDSDENSPIYNVDASPTLNSTNAVQSGGTKVALNSLDSRKMEHGVITGDFSASVDYRVGDLVFYATTANGITTRTLYRCTTDHDTAAWNPAHFTATTIEVELQRVRDSEADTDMIGDLFGTKTTYAVGDYCIYNDNLYRCIQAVDNTGATTPAFDPEDWTQVALANDVSDLNSALSAYENKISENLLRRDLTEGVLECTIANIDGNYTLYPNINERVMYFPVESGKTYTVYKGSSMSNCRIAYSDTKPILNDVVTGYADFSSVLLYKIFTANQTGYACVKIAYSGDDIPTVLHTACAYNGSYDESIASDTADIFNIKSINSEEWTSVIDTINTVMRENIILGYLDAQVTASAITHSTNGTKISIYFPIKNGARYTLDKKVFTAHTRCGYTTNIPAYGDVPDSFELLDNGSGCEHVTFTAPQNGYAIIWVLDTVVNAVTLDYIKQNSIVYEEDYRAIYTKATMKQLDIVSNANHVFYCGAGRELATLKAGIEKATQYMNAVLYVDPGTYDLVSEFGQAWFDNLTNITMVGLQLKNRIHVIFSPNSKVVSHYMGSNEYAQKLYSPFNAGEYGFTLENLNLECSRCRYAIHDERNSASEQFKSSYINCKMKIDNSENDYWSNHHCIGGGLGANAEVMIRNCVFECDEPIRRWGVYYHIPNVASTTSYRAIVVIKDNYFVSGTVTLADVSATPQSTSDNSEYIIANNSFSQKYEGTDTQGIYNSLVKSYNLREWGNSWRS